jgi:hypothetical protein
MNVHPVTFPGRRFAIIAIVHIATIVVVAGALALALTPLLAKYTTTLKRVGNEELTSRRLL